MFTFWPLGINGGASGDCEHFIAKTIETDARIRVEAPLKVEPWKESAVRKLSAKTFP